jgi:predicted kinase
MSRLGSLVTEARELLEFEGDLKKQCVVLMGLPAAGKSTFVRTQLKKYLPNFKGFQTTNSDAQVKRLQYTTARDHWEVLRKIKTEAELQKFIVKHRFKDNGGQMRELPLTLAQLQTFKGLRDYYNAMNKPFYAVYFDIRDLAKEFDAKLFADKVSKSANLLVIDTVAAKPGKVLRRLQAARDQGFQTSIFYLEVAPELCVVRDRYRGETEGRTVGEGVIFNYAKNMDRAYTTYKQEGEKADGLVDRLYHFLWKPAGASPIKGNWRPVAAHKYDVKRSLKAMRRKAR